MELLGYIAYGIICMLIGSALTIAIKIAVWRTLLNYAYMDGYVEGMEEGNK